MSKELVARLLDEFTLDEVRYIVAMVLCGRTVDSAIQDVLEGR